MSIKQTIGHRLNRFRHSLSYVDALPQLTLLGLVVGLMTGAIIAIFRLAIELPLSQFLSGSPEDFESLSVSARILINFVGIGLLIALLYSVKKHQREMSVAHVIDRLHNHQGHLPFRNWLVQFLGATISIISGQSVGREGPAVHLGAGVASQAGSWLKLPKNSMSTLIACGVASAIATSFNTPLAGVIFAMEVILMEYTIIGFVPVILAAVMGTMISHVIFSKQGDFDFQLVEITTLMELPYMVLMGLMISVLAMSYTKLHLFTLRFNQRPLWLRLILAGCITAIAGALVPEIMGLGYDTVNQAARGELVIGSVIVILLAKLVVTPVILALGIPGGLIGPSLMIGAMAGTLFGVILDMVVPNLGVNSAFYVMMGMAGMMAAVLNAPLAALVAVLELTSNMETIFPAMLVIVVACVSTRQFFGIRGIFVEQLAFSNRDLDFGPASQALRRAGIRSVLNTQISVIERTLSAAMLETKLLSRPEWLIFYHESDAICLPAADAANYLNQQQAEDDQEEIDLLQIPGRRHTMAGIDDTATLLQAVRMMQAKNTDVLFITQLGPHFNDKIQGLVTKSSIENFYQPKEFNNVMG